MKKTRGRGISRMEVGIEQSICLEEDLPDHVYQGWGEWCSHKQTAACAKRLNAAAPTCWEICLQRHAESHGLAWLLEFLRWDFSFSSRRWPIYGFTQGWRFDEAGSERENIHVIYTRYRRKWTQEGGAQESIGITGLEVLLSSRLRGTEGIPKYKWKEDNMIVKKSTVWS